MKFLALLLSISTGHAIAQATNYRNFVRQTQQTSGVVWDMQDVAPNGAAPSALALENQGALFQLWTIHKSTAIDYLLDQKLVGAYLPKADVKIITLDPYGPITRTRIDKPFRVEIQVSELLSGIGLPDAATRVLLAQHIQSYTNGQVSLNPTTVASTAPITTRFISQNGLTLLSPVMSSLRATDPTKAIGEEHFIIHALSDGTFTQSQIASAKVQVWPIASGTIAGITSGMHYRGVIPTITLNLTDLYPRSDTKLMVYPGTQVNPATGIVVKPYAWDSDRSQTITITSEELNTLITKDGTYTIALLSETVFDSMLLAAPVTFSVGKTMTVNAMQVKFSN